MIFFLLVIELFYQPFFVCLLLPFLDEKRVFHKKFSFTPFSNLFVLRHASNNTASPNIGGTDAWAVPPPQILWGRPPVPPEFRPCLLLLVVLLILLLLLLLLLLLPRRLIQLTMTCQHDLLNFSK